MGRCSGDRRGRRRLRRTAATALVALLAACGGDGEDESAEPQPQSTAIAPSTETPSTVATTTTTPELPEGSVAVPIEDRLAQRLPELDGLSRTVLTDPAFDERLCDGEKAPTTPEGQAVAVYDVGPDQSLTIAAYRFASGVAPYYVAVYTEAVESCAKEVGDRADLGLVGVPAFVQGLSTERGGAFIGVVLRGDVLWVMYQQGTGGAAEVDPATVDAFVAAIED